MSDSHVPAFHIASRQILDTQYVLEDLALAFERTGNLLVARELREHIGTIDQARAAMDRAFSDELLRSVKQAQESTWTMLQATLAGVEIGKQNMQMIVKTATDMAERGEL